ncbi:MAG: hypothetical protein Q9217_005022 [Psora testacea]
MPPTQVQGTGLSSNNPFRNRATSPANCLPQSPAAPTTNFPHTAPERPTSRNPFLDQSEKNEEPTVYVRPLSPQKDMSNISGRAPPMKPVLTGHAAELFDNLSLNNRPSTNGNTTRQANPPPSSTRIQRSDRSENVPPTFRAALPGHQPSLSQEDERRIRRGAKPRHGTEELDIFADPPAERRLRPRPRRNSDSSIVSRTLNPEEERRRRERHRRERENRHRGDGKQRPSTSHKSKKPTQRLDIIDSLDVTSIYGKGLFHHDGPFDACNPDRNRKGSRRAPMEAFAKDSANNILGGSGPLNKDIDFAQFHGRGAEGFTDYSTSGTANPLAEPVSFEPYAGSSAPIRTGHGVRPGVDRTSSFNPRARVDHVHGEESLGLGTSTFLEGAPAARAAIQRRESETDHAPGVENSGALGRKRSLAQRIRGISNANRERGFRPAGRVTSPETLERTMTPTSPGEVQSAGGMPRIKESNPFFSEYDAAYEKKGQKIQIVEEKNRRGRIDGGEDQVNVDIVARSRAMSSPKRAAPAVGGLERRVTNDGTTAGIGEPKESGGFLSRVKSLKGGKRTRPERVV